MAGRRTVFEKHLKAGHDHAWEFRWDKAAEQYRLALAEFPEEAPALVALAQAYRELGRTAEASEVYRSLVRVAPSDSMPLTPADETERKALTERAGALFEEKAEEPSAVSQASEAATGERVSVDALISGAIDYQTRGLVDEAISSYLRLLKMGEDRPAIHFNLGLLFQQQMRFEEAIERLRQSAKYPEYRLGSHFALGQCYRAQGQVETSMEHFLEVIKIVDMETVGREQADDLIQLYENLVESYRATGDAEKAKAFSDSLVQFLSGKGWQDKVREARKRLDAAGDGVTVSLAELLESHDSDEVLRALSLSQEYFRRGLLTASSEECYRAIELAPR